MRTDSTITIFNRKVVEHKETFLPTVISGVTWYGSQGVAAQNDSDDTFKVRIPLNADRSGKDYLEATAYKTLSVEAAADFWTIQAGDFVVRGEMEDAVSGQSELSASREDFFVVRSYSDNTIRGSDYLKHWRIGGV